MILESPQRALSVAFTSLLCLLIVPAPAALASDLIVCGGGGLLRLDPNSGELREIISTEPDFTSVRSGPGGDVYALKASAGTIHRFDGASFNYLGPYCSSNYLEGAAGFTFDSSGRLVAAKGTTIYILNVDTDSLAHSIHLYSAGLRVMAGVATGQDGHIYASDAGSGRMFRVDLGTSDNPVSVLPDRFGVPRGIAFDSEAALLTADSGTTPVLVRLEGDDRSFGGFFPDELPANHQLQEPVDLAIGPDGKVVVADLQGSKLLQFDSRLNFIGAVGEGSSRIGQQPRSLAFTVQPPGGEIFEDWRQEHFSDTELADESVSGLWADPMGDGKTNLLRYGLGVGPWAAISGHLPAQWTETIDDNEYLFVTYTRARGRSDLEVRAEVSSDLVLWDSSPERLEVIQVENLGGLERVTLRGSVPPWSANRHFLRIRVIYHAQ